MAWNPEPDVAALRDFADKFGRSVVVAFSIEPDGKAFCVTSFGQTKQLCKMAAVFGNEIFEHAQSGKFTMPQVEPDGEPVCRRRWVDAAAEADRVVDAVDKACSEKYVLPDNAQDPGIQAGISIGQKAACAAIMELMRGGV